jgi:O-antigen ligase
MPLIAAVAFIEENNRSTNFFVQSAPLIRIGQGFYTTMGGLASPAYLAWLVLAIVGYSRTITRSQHGESRPRDANVLLLGAAVVWTFFYGVIQDAMSYPLTDLCERAVRASGPFATVLAAYLATDLWMRKRTTNRLPMVLCIVVTLKAGIAAFLVLQGRAATIDGQKFVVYYDAASPMLAAGILLVVSFGRLNWSRPLRALLFISTATIVVLSFRRSVWTAVLVGSIAIPLLQHNNGVLRRTIPSVILALVVLLALPGSLRATLVGRVVSAAAVARGEGNEGPAVLHRGEIASGWKIATHHPISGVGVNSPQLLPFRTATPTLYVHDEYLQTWLRFGIVGIALLLAMLVRAAVLSAGVLRRGANSEGLVAAALCLTMSIPIATAPFLTSTSRWPAMFGIAFAVVARTSVQGHRTALRHFAGANQMVGRPCLPTAI